MSIQLSVGTNSENNSQLWAWVLKMWNYETWNYVQEMWIMRSGIMWRKCELWVVELCGGNVKYEAWNYVEEMWIMRRGIMWRKCELWVVGYVEEMWIMSGGVMWRKCELWVVELCGGNVNYGKWNYVDEMWTMRREHWKCALVNLEHLPFLRTKYTF